MIQKQELDKIYYSVVSIYIQMAKINKIQKQDFTIILDLIKALFQKEIAPETIQAIVKNPQSIRSATNYLNRIFSKSDKIKFVLNLFNIVYHQQGHYQVLGSLEIIKVFDLFRLEVDLYDQILDVLENKSQFIELNSALFIAERESSILKNDLFLGASSACDYYFRTAEDTYFFAIILQNTIGICTNKHDFLHINKKPLVPDTLYFLGKSSIQVNASFSLDKTQLTTLYNAKVEKINRLTHYEWGKNKIIVEQKGTSIQLSIESGSATLNNEYFTNSKRFALNDVLTLDDTFLGYNVYLGVQKFIQKVNAHQTAYLCREKKFYSIRFKESKNSIAKLQKQNDDIIIEPLQQANLYLNNEPLLTNHLFLFNSDVLTIDQQSFKINKYYEILKVDFVVTTMKVDKIYHEFKTGKKTALDNIAFQINKNELLAIMGPSGSGKTTLMKALLGEINPTEKRVYLDNIDFYKNQFYFLQYIGYVPQDDLLFSNLTVYENLYYCARLRLPHLKDNEEIRNRIYNILKQVDLLEKKDLKVGNAEQKSLSGGQRKRLNIALELLSDPQIIFLDEPTSGLSSKDSEKLIQLLNELKESGKIIIAVIHQPNATIFSKFDKFLLLDRGGVQVYFGSINDAFSYFDEELQLIKNNNPSLLEKKSLKSPDYFFDILEYLDQSFDDTSNDNKRKFEPEYWKKKYQNHILLQIIKDSTKEDESDKRLESNKKEKSKKSLHQNFSQFYFLFHRNLKNKFTNKMNLFMTFFVSPVLAFVVSFILRFSPQDLDYTFYENSNIIVFIFISIIIFIFLGLANSLDDILTEKRIFSREKKIGVSSSHYLNSKILTHTIISVVQTLLFLVISSITLQIRGVFLYYFLYLFLSEVIGFSIGLYSSAILTDRKAVIQVLPLVLIPQIMFAGAVIDFEKMNTFLKIHKNSSAPEFCNLVPSKWIFEALIVAQGSENFYDRFIRKQQEKKKDSKTYAVSCEVNDIISNFTKINKKQHYRNKLISNGINKKNARFLNSKKNIFGASKLRFFGTSVKKTYFNTLVLLLMITIINYFTLKKLEKE